METDRLKWIAFFVPAALTAGFGAGLPMLLPDFALSPTGHLTQALLFVLGALLFSRWVFARVGVIEARLRHRTQQLTALNDLALTIARQLQVEPLLEQVAHGARQLVNADTATFHLWENEHHPPRMITSARNEASRPAAPSPLLTRMLFELGEPVRVLSRRQLCVPVFARRRLLGLLCLTDPARPEGFTTEDGQSVQMLASIAAASLENASLFEEVQRTEVQRRRIALLEERERIGMDLHDGAIQSLYAVGLSLQATARRLPPHAESVRERLSQAAAQLSTVIQDLREYILDLRPHTLGLSSLTDGLQQLAERLSTEEGLTVSHDLPQTLPEVSPDTVGHLLHVAGEAISNVIRHSGATAAHLGLATTDGNLTLTIRDNGKGLCTNGALPAERRGLRNMRARAALLGGECQILASPGKGTELRVTIPLEE